MSIELPMDVVLDASVAIKSYVPENLATEARRFMTPGCTTHVPSFFAAECGNTIWKKVAQRHELDQRIGREILDELLAYPHRIHDAASLTALAYDLAHQINNPRLALYDFIYLAIAVALDCRMVTADAIFRDSVRSTPFASQLIWVADPL